MSFEDRELSPGLFSALHRFYSQRLYQRIKSLRGATRLKSFLKKRAKRDLDSPENPVEAISEREWKNLIILDGCRHDLYEAVNGDTDYRISAGSMSRDYISKNFSSGDWSDVIYITANPFFSEEHFSDLTGRKVEEVFHSVFHTYQTKWDDKNNTVMPSSVVEDVLTAQKLFPEKRKIIHFMQPHHPFVESDLVEKGFDDILKKETYEQEWGLASKGKIDRDEVSEAYKNNLKFVMPHVEELVDQFERRTIITSDHGNYVGEAGLYGHPSGEKSKVLRKVPLDIRD